MSDLQRFDLILCVSYSVIFDSTSIAQVIKKLGPASTLGASPGAADILDSQTVRKFHLSAKQA